MSQFSVTSGTSRRLSYSVSMLALGFAAWAFPPAIQAATYYWDTNGATAGWGTTTGTWGSSSFISTSSAGTAATANTTTGTADTLFFGTTASRLTSALTVPLSTNRSIGNISIATGSNDFTLQSGGTLTIVAGGTISYDNNGAGDWTRIYTPIAGSGNVNWVGPTNGRLGLYAAASYSGTSIISAGIVTFAGANVAPAAGDVSVTGGELQINSAQSLGQISWSGGSITGSGTVTISGGDGVKVSGGNRTFTQDIVLATAGNNFQAESTRVMTLSGDISESGGARGIDIYYSSAGAGRTILSGSNSFTGGIRVQQGVLTVGGSFAIPTTGTMAIDAGTQLQLNGYNVTVQGLNLAGTSVSDGAINNNSATPVTLTPTNGTTLTANANIGGTGDITLANGISGGFSLTKVGAGGVTLTGAGSYTGATSVNAGTLTLRRGATSASSGVTVASVATLEYDTNAGNMTFATPDVALSGTLAYTASGNHYVVLNTGAVDVPANANSAITLSSGGVSSAGLFTDGGLTGSGTVTVTPANNGVGLVLRTATTTFSGDIIVGGNASATAGTGSGVVIGNNSGAPNLSAADFTVNGTLELGNSTSGMGWAAGSVSGGTASIGALRGSGVVVANMASASSTRTLSVGNSNVSGTFSGVIANGANNTLAFRKAGTAGQTLTGANSYAGATTVTAGTLTIGTGGSVNSASLLSISSGATVNFSQAAANAFGSTTQSGTWSIAGTLRATTAQANTVVANVSLTSGTIDSTGGNASDFGTFYFSNKTITANGSGNVISASSGNGRLGIANTVTLATPLAGDSLTVSAGLGSNTASGNNGSLVKTGPGTVTLSGSNTYTGATTISGGTLTLGSGNALPSSTAVTVAGGGLNMSTFSDTVSSLTITSGSVFGSGTLTAGGYTLGGGVAAANLGSGTLTVTNSATLSGGAAASVVRLNAGTLTLSSGSRLSALPAVSGSSGATLALGGNESLGSLAGAAAIVLGGNTLTVGGNNDNSAYAGALTGIGAFVKVGSGTLTFSGTVPNGVATTVSAGGFLSNGVMGTGSLSVAAAAWLAGTGTVGGPVSVSGTLSPGASPGLLTLGSLVLSGSSTTIMEIAGATRGSLYDSIDITDGGIAFDGTLRLDFQNTFADNTTFLLFGVSTGTGGLTGSFASVTAVGSYGSLSFQNVGSGVWSSGQTGISNQEIRFSQITGEVIVVPEPGVTTLIAASVGVAWMMRRRRRGGE